VITFVDEMLQQPDPIFRAFAGEREFSKNSIDHFFKDPAWYFGESPHDPETLKAIQQIKQMSPQQKASIKATLIAGIDENYRKTMEKLTLPASTWDVPQEDEEDSAPASTIEGMIASILDPGVYDQVLVSVGRRQAQLSLFRLHAVIIRFKWHHHRLPKNLKEVEAPRYTKDPLSDGDFVYEPSGDTYDLYSKGYKSTGPIHLRYQKQPGVGDKVEPPRPWYLSQSVVRQLLN
jgi:hypothetical protein